MMNKKNNFLKAAALACVALLSFQSCLEDDGYSLNKSWISIATVNPLKGRSYDLTLDDGKTLWPAASDFPGYKPKKDQRALVNYTILSDSTSGYSHYIKVNAIEDILTKAVAKDLGLAENDSVYGTDKLRIKDAWIGDGFLNVVFLYNIGGTVKHFVNLIPDTKAGAGAYDFEFRHNAYDDPESRGAEGIVAFNLDSLPDTEGKTVKMNIRYNSFDGEKTTTLDFQTK